VKIKTPYIVVPMNLLNVKGECAYILIKCIVYPKIVFLLSNQLKPNIMYLIETGNSIEDVENGCVKPSNGAEFTKERALETLEKRYGGK
jgi:hypothetical protein